MKNKTQIIKGCALALIPTSLCATMAGVNVLNMAYAETNSGYVTSHQASVTISNSSFATSNDPYYISNTFTGWSVTSDTTSSSSLGAIINTIDDTSSNSFAKNKSKFFLDENPLAHGSDTKILMINSVDKNGKTQQSRKGYSSSSITLQANSFYKFSVAVKTINSASASVYLNGLKDKNGETLSLKYEGLSNTTWQEVNFFIATGKESQTITLDLYLGSASGQISQGAVFFDDVQGTRFSENEFYSEIKSAGYTADNFSTAHSSHSDAIFIINELLESRPFIANIDDYNFDFENPIAPDTNTLGDEFMIKGAENGHAIIQNIADMQPSDFKKLTGYNYIGTDLGKDNKQALILYTGKMVGDTMTNQSGYVGVESKQIDIKAHAIYKISLKVKVATKGSFYLKVQENDEVLNNYSSLLTDNEDDATNLNKTLYALNNKSSSTISSNTSNAFENDYQTLSFYLKGNSLYDSSVNLELWLGDSQTPTEGCVIVDNITVEYASYSDYNSASNKLELTSTLPSDDKITNGRFNSSENQEAGENYLVNASNWTVEKQDNCDSGIVYIDNADLYNQMYSSNREKYPWAGIYPDKIDLTNSTPNNVYLMNNRTSSYQSLTSNTFSLATTTESDKTYNFHKLSFNYYTQNGSTESKIKVEVIDDNGIVLFSKSDIASQDTWSEFNVYFHTHALVSHTAKVKISLGEEGKEVCGLVYLDNFSLTSSENYESTFATATNKSDLTKLGSDEATTGNVSLSNFYTFSDGNNDFTSPIQPTGTTGGIVDGKNNAYGEYNDKLKKEGNYFVLTSRDVGYVKMTSKYKISFKKDEYYKLKFDLATIFGESALTAKTDNHDCKYGVSVEIDGFETLSQMLSADQFKTIEVFFKAGAEDKTSNIVIKIVTDCENTYGTALISGIDFSKSSEVDYTQAQRTADNDKVYIAKATETTTEPDEDDTPSEDNTQTSTDNAWILIPSIITGLAIIIWLVAYAMKHIKIKKIEKVKKEAYDRKLAVNHDAIMVEAQKRRDEELEALNKVKDALINEKNALEKEYNDFIRTSREENGGKISRGLEKAFKVFSSKINKQNEKINIIKEKIDYTISAEYLLVIERKILAEQDELETKNKKNKTK